jgi:hypothetical protein
MSAGLFSMSPYSNYLLRKLQSPGPHTGASLFAIVLIRGHALIHVFDDFFSLASGQACSHDGHFGPTYDAV